MLDKLLGDASRTIPWGPLQPRGLTPGQRFDENGVSTLSAVVPIR